MADVIQFPKENEIYIIKIFIEGFGLEYPKDYPKFAEVFSRFDEWLTVGELFDVLIEAFPDKKESILDFPMYAEIDGKMVRVRLHEKDLVPLERCRCCPGRPADTDAGESHG
jgi:hypothetical protein